MPSTPHRGAGRPKYEVAEIVRAHGEQLRSVVTLRPEQHRALRAIAQCRTASLGGHLDRCRRCDFAHPSYNSCRNRHCPKCQALAQERWIDARSRRILPVGHFHVVFTVPSELHALMAFRRRELFAALFGSAAETLSELGATKLGITMGTTLVLHTWTRDLRFHPHVHGIVTAGGLALDGSRWVPRDGFLLSVHLLGALLRGKMMDAVRRLHRNGQLDGFEPFEDPQAFEHMMTKLAKHRWVVYAKNPFASARHVLHYLGRYTHRVAIANSRLLSVGPEHVTFRTREQRTATVTPLEFLRRFVQHVLPPRFVKIRHYGLYAATSVDGRLARARELLPQRPAPAPLPASFVELLLLLVGRDLTRCPRCGGILVTELLTTPALTPCNPVARAPPMPL